MTVFPEGFLWGASTSAHQTEGQNVNSDWWQREGRTAGMESSGDGVDSYHRYPEDMLLLAEAGLNSYRFSIEWARIQPRPEEFSLSQLAHYRRMIDKAQALGLKPIVTLHHFTSPQWFQEEGGWMGERAVERFSAYVTRVTEILQDIEFIVTINEPNILALMVSYTEALDSGESQQWQSPTAEPGVESGGQLPPVLPTPNTAVGKRLIEAHKAVRGIVREKTKAQVGWSVGSQAFTPTAGNEAKLEEIRYAWEDFYLDAAVDDDFIGLQAYSSQPVDANGPVPHPESPDNTMIGSAFRPDALSIAARHVAERTGGVPILVTENGIATSDDAQRISYTQQALEGLAAVIASGITVRGYLHWSALDNYEWGHWDPTFGLIAVDRTTFERQPKPSLAWLGQVSKSNGSFLDQPQ